MNEIVRQDYFGSSVEFRRDDAGSGDLWITAVAHLEGVVSRLFSALDRMTGIVDVHASNAGRLLSYLSRNPPPDHPGQVRLFDDGGNPKLTG